MIKLVTYQVLVGRKSRAGTALLVTKYFSAVGTDARIPVSVSPVPLKQIQM